MANQIQFKLDTESIKKTLIHWGIIGGSAAVVAIYTAAMHQDYGTYQGIATVILSLAGTFIKEYISGIPVSSSSPTSPQV